MKLSELGKGMMLTVQHITDEEFEVMTIEDFLESDYYLDFSKFPTKVTVANETVVDFNLNNILDYLAESETHESWIENVLHDIDKSNIDVEGFEEEINKIFAKNPTYWEGEVVEIYVFPQ